MNRLELIQSLDAKRADIEKAFASARDENGEFKADADVEAIEVLSAEVTDLEAKLDGLKRLDEIDAKRAKVSDYARPSFAVPEVSDRPKSFGEAFAESKFADQLRLSGNAKSELDLEVKTLFSTGAGWAPAQVRDDRVALYPTRALRLFDVLPSMEWGASAYRFMEETTFTNNAAERAESVEGTLAAYAESAFALTERSVDLRMVAHSLPMSIEQLEDVPAVAQYLNDRLVYGLQARAEYQLVNGNGTAPNIRGLLNISGIQTQAKGADSAADALYKAMTLVRVNGHAEPNLIVMHPTDWQGIRLAQNVGGQYVYETNLAAAGATALFGVPVVITTAIAQGTALTLDTSHVAVINRRGVRLATTESHDTDFTNGVVRVRADVRLALAGYRGVAIAKVTGL